MTARRPPAAARWSPLPSRTADVVIVGAGVQGASLAFHLASRGAKVLVVERSFAASGATEALVRLRADALRPRARGRARLALVPLVHRVARPRRGRRPGLRAHRVRPARRAAHADALRANVANQQSARDRHLGRRPGRPCGDRARHGGRRRGRRLLRAAERVRRSQRHGGGAARRRASSRRRVRERRAGDGRAGRERPSTGVETAGRRGRADRRQRGGRLGRELAATAGVDIPVEPWRHDTAYFGLPAARPASIPIVLDHARAAYFRPEGRDLLLVGLETGNEVGGSPDAPLPAFDEGILPAMVERVTARVPWMADGDFRSGNKGQDGMTPDQRAILGPAGPDGLYLDCGHSGSGFKTAPMIGQCLAEWILDGRPRTVNLRPFLLDRFADGRPLVGEHPYESLWR
ncbi:MAG: FAD-binding oxidoreductase [Chloroflexota bacterium]